MWLGGGNCRRTNDNWRHLNPFYVKKRTRKRRGRGKREREGEEKGEQRKEGEEEKGQMEGKRRRGGEGRGREPSSKEECQIFKLENKHVFELVCTLVGTQGTVSAAQTRS